MSECKKCGSNDVLTRHISAGKLIDSSSIKKIDDEFVLSNEYDFYYQLKAKKEHLSHHCRSCQYGWRTNTLDSKTLTPTKG